MKCMWTRCLPVQCLSVNQPAVCEINILFQVFLSILQCLISQILPHYAEIRRRIHKRRCSQNFKYLSSYHDWKQVQQLCFCTSTEKKKSMGKYIDQTRLRHRTSTYQKCLKNYKKVKIGGPPQTDVEERLIFFLFMLYNMKVNRLSVVDLFQSCTL